VEHDHPHAFEFLRSDLRNVDEFFTRRSGAAVRTLGLRRAWDFVVSDTVDDVPREGERGPEGEERLIEVVRNWLEADETVDAGDDAVFMSSYIPRNLGEVYDPERDVDLLNEGRGGQLIYAGLTGLDGGPAAGEATAADAMSDGSSDDDASSDSADSARGATERNRGFRHEDRDAKKVGRVNRCSLTLCSGAEESGQRGEAREAQAENAQGAEAKAGQEVGGEVAHDARIESSQSQCINPLVR
jgi:RIO kinase 1